MPTPKIPTTNRLAGALAVDAPSQTESSADANGLDREPYKGSDVPNFSLSDQFGWLLQQYRNLMRTLLREISAPSYEIAEESRSRIRADIILTQRREMNTLSQVYYPRLPSLANPRTMQMQHPVTTGSRIREYPGSKVDVDQFSAPVWTQHGRMSTFSSSFAPSTTPFTNHAKTQPQIPEAQFWTPANDAQSCMPPPEASPRFPPPEFHSHTVPPAQLHSSFQEEVLTLPMSDSTLESRFRRDNSASQSDTLRPSQPDSAGGVTPWQQRGRDDCRNDYDEYQSTTLSSGDYSHFSGSVAHPNSTSPLSPDRYRFCKFTGRASHGSYYRPLTS